MLKYKSPNLTKGGKFYKLMYKKYIMANGKQD
jgi:hypothetical protein